MRKVGSARSAGGSRLSSRASDRMARRSGLTPQLGRVVPGLDEDGTHGVDEAGEASIAVRSAR